MPPETAVTSTMNTQRRANRSPQLSPQIAVNDNDDAANPTAAASPPPFLVYYRNVAYDIARFAPKHPGGRNTLAGLQGRDMERRLRTAPPHSPAAMYLLREYRVDNDAANNIANDPTTTTTDSIIMHNADDCITDDKSSGSHKGHRTLGKKNEPLSSDAVVDDADDAADAGADAWRNPLPDESMEVGGVIRRANSVASCKL